MFAEERNPLREGKHQYPQTEPSRRFYNRPTWPATFPSMPAGKSLLFAAAAVIATITLSALTAQPRHGEMPNRIPEEAPYNTKEAVSFHPRPDRG